MSLKLTLKDIKFSQGDFNLGVSLNIPEGEFGCLLGPSGCGKTTILKLIGGFLLPAEGSILLGDRDITDLEPHRRKLGIVFQDYALFPHLSVADNITYGLKVPGIPRTDRLSRDAMGKRTGELLKLVKLEGFEDRKVPSLSGGEQQRVALARALAPNPDLLLLDEPLSALDVQLRGNLRREIRRIQETLGITTLYITHDQEEALTLSDRIFMLKNGTLIQEGTPEEIYSTPKTLFAGQFLGKSNTLNTNGTHLFFRPEDCMISPSKGKYQGTIVGGEYYGAFFMAEVNVGDEKIRLQLPIEYKFARGDSIYFSIMEGRERIFPAD